MRFQSRFISSLCTSLVMAMAATQVHAQERTIRIVVPFAAGDASDKIARLIAEPLGQILDKQVVIDNRHGAGGMVATQEVIRSPTDGLTLVLGSTSNMSANPACRGERITYQPSSSLRPVAFLARAPLVLAVAAHSPIDNYSDLVSHLKARPGIGTFASSGLCGYTDIIGRYWAHSIGAEAVSFPYKSGSIAVEETISGYADVVIAEMPSVAASLSAQRAKLILTSEPLQGKTASTFNDVGLEAVSSGIWYGLFAPAETPSREIGFIQRAAQQVMSDPTVVSALTELGAEPLWLSGSEIYREVVNETRRIEGLIKAASLTLE